MSKAPSSRMRESASPTTGCAAQHTLADITRGLQSISKSTTQGSATHRRRGPEEKYTCITLPRNNQLQQVVLYKRRSHLIDQSHALVGVQAVEFLT